MHYDSIRRTQGQRTFLALFAPSFRHAPTTKDIQIRWPIMYDKYDVVLRNRILHHFPKDLRAVNIRNIDQACDE